MPDYLGYWLECRNRNCGFPIRVSEAAGRKDRTGKSRKAGAFLFACPVCLQVNHYRSSDLGEVRFRAPDPYGTGRLALYSVRFACARRGCRSQLEVFTVAAANLSIALLLRFWERWKIKVRCRSGHPFRVPGLELWWIERQQALALTASEQSLSKK